MKVWRVNLYYLLNGEKGAVYNTYLSQAAVTMQTIIKAGGEITGIIESERDE